MSDHFVARTQRNITYIWMVGFFTVLILEGLGHLKGINDESLYALTGVVLFFWFQRLRSQTDTVDPPAVNGNKSGVQSAPNPSPPGVAKDETKPPR